MSADKIKIGDSLPKIVAVKPLKGLTVEVAWKGDKGLSIVDLSSAIFTYKLYRPLRDDPELFRTVHTAANGSAIAWGNGELDMSAALVEQLAAETMQPSDFAAFLRRNNLSLDAAAAQLGISRRLVAYYASERQVPRYIALACSYIEHKQTQSRVAHDVLEAEVVREFLSRNFHFRGDQVWAIESNRVVSKPQRAVEARVREERNLERIWGVKH